MPSTKYIYFKCPECNSMMWFETDKEGNIFKYHSQNALNCDKCSSMILTVLERGVLNIKKHRVKKPSEGDIFTFPKEKY